MKYIHNESFKLQYKTFNYYQLDSDTNTDFFIM